MGEKKQDQDAFIKVLEANGQLVDVKDGQDVSSLPPKVTHIRRPDGSIKRIRFSASLTG